MNSWFWPVSAERRFRRSAYGGASIGREGIRILKRELVRASRWLQAVRDRQPQISSCPTMLLWGGDDHLFGPDELRTWEALFRNTRTLRFEEAGHFVCEDLGADIVPHLEGFLGGIDRR